MGAADSPASLVDAWMESPTHREVILGGEWWTMGTASFRLENGRLISVVVFSDSRWQEKSLIYNGARLELEGVFLRDNRVQPTEIFASVFGRRHAPDSVQPLPDGSVLVRFMISCSEWNPPVPMMLYAGELQNLKQTDMVLLE